MREINKSQMYRYAKEDVYRIPVDSGGISHPKYFIKKDTKESIENQIKKLEEDILIWKRQVELAEDEIRRLKKQ